MVVTQEEEYQHGDKVFMDNGQANVCGVRDFFAIVSFWYQNNTF
jgi:hypothetical protein